MPDDLKVSLTWSPSFRSFSNEFWDISDQWCGNIGIIGIITLYIVVGWPGWYDSSSDPGLGISFKRLIRSLVPSWDAESTVVSHEGAENLLLGRISL
jgi:hypothetical protein